VADQLATPADLAALLQMSTVDNAALLLELATAKVQAACGGQRLVDLTDTAVIPILPGCPYEELLDLPQWPVRSVATVQLDGVTITDWRLAGQQLWRLLGWQTLSWEPSQVTVLYTHGYPAGAQGLQLARDAVLSLAAAGFGNPTGAASEAIDDYRVSYAEADARMQLTEHTRAALAAAYGRPAYVTDSR
jgi:hypothetical protein